MQRLLVYQKSFEVGVEDWKRFCFVLREVARGGDDGRPLPNFEAQRRAQAVLTE
jgi:hypothetical protein